MSLRRRSTIALTGFLIALFVCANVATDIYYGIVSLGTSNSATLMELPGYTDHRVITQLTELRAKMHGGVTVSDAANLIVAKLEAAYTTNTSFLVFTPFLGRASVLADDKEWYVGPVPFKSEGLRDQIRSYMSRHNSFYENLVHLDVRSKSDVSPFDTFVLDTRLEAARRHPHEMWLLESINPTLFNAWGAPDQTPPTIALQPYLAVHDFLAYVPSDRNDYGGGSRRQMLWRFEPDYYYPGKKMEAFGRYLLFNIVNPDGPLRFVISMTASLSADHDNRIPAVEVVTNTRVPFPTAGRGSARLFSAPFVPEDVHGFDFAELDMGRDGKLFPDQRVGLMRLFGTEFVSDFRHIVGFTRDISVIPDRVYRALQAPERISAFPQDLANPQLEYSGFYEDGWVGEEAFAMLAAPKRGPVRLSLRGAVPNLGSGIVRAVFTSDGHVVSTAVLTPGPFELGGPAKADGKRHRIDVTFSRSWPLPNGDGRPVTAHIDFFGFE